MDIDVIRKALVQHGYEISEEKRYRNYAWQFKLHNGSAVFCGDSGPIWCQGRDRNRLMDVLAPIRASSLNNNKVFIVYGRDASAKNELVDLLRQWDIEPMAIDSLPTNGRTIIEQLEHYIPKTNYGIVLATPDDIGYLSGHPTEARFRARQNVVLELGMLFAKLGRSRVGIILKQCDNFERPSDIEGVLYPRPRSPAGSGSCSRSISFHLLPGR